MGEVQENMVLFMYHLSLQSTKINCEYFTGWQYFAVLVQNLLFEKKMQRGSL
jgi:hypothetical protein